MGRVTDNRKKLIDAVLELIWTGSYATTTIEQICDKARVRKGSFYYYFRSKADVAAAAVDLEWASKRTQLDSIFSSVIPPLQRLQNYCDLNCRFQTEIKSKYGHVLGCPLFSLGAEVSTQESALQKKVQENLDY